MDPASAATSLAIKAAQHVGREEGALRRFLGKSELKRLVEQLEKGVEADSEIPFDRRDEVVATVKSLLLEPPVVGLLYRYLEDGEEAALGDLEKELERLLPSSLDAVQRSAAAARIAHLIRKIAPDTFRSDKQANRFDHLRTRDVVKTEGESTRARLDEVESQLGNITELLEQQPKPAIIALVPVWAPETQQKMLKELAEIDPELAGWISEVLDSSDVQAAGQKAADLIASSDPRLELGPAVLWSLLASTTQRTGDWEKASRAWKEASTRFAAAGNPERQVDTLVSAAVALQLAGDPRGYESLIEQARELDALNPRIAMEDIGQIDDGAERLARLEQIKASSDAERALLHLNRGLAHLMQLDTDKADSELEEALKTSGETVQTRLLRINILVQRGREAVSFGRSIDGRSLRKAMREALELRQELLGERRYDEAVRMLMLATDALMLDRGPHAGKVLLLEATEEERAWPEGAEILGEAALRAQEPLLALWLTSSSPDSPDVRRIRAMAEIKMPGMSLDGKQEAAAELDAVLEQPDLVGLQAAASRCLACLHEPKLPWNEAAEKRVQGTYFEQWANGLHAVHVAQTDGLQAADVLIEQSELPPALRAEVRFQSAVEAGRKEEAAERADELRKHGTDQSMEALCAIAYFEAKNFSEAALLATALTDDAGAPDSVREEMYRLRCKVAEIEGDWRLATEVVSKALESFPTDDWLNSFRVKAAARS